MVLPGTCLHWTGTSVIRRPETPGPGQDLDVEGEAVDRYQVEEEAGDGRAEGLEPALGVLQAEPGPGRSPCG